MFCSEFIGFTHLDLISQSHTVDEQTMPPVTSLNSVDLEIHVVKKLLHRVEPDTWLKRVSGTDKALLPSTSIIRVIRVNICARIE